MTKECECAAHSAAECCCGAWDAPPQRTWVGLTDEESVELMRQVPHLTIGGLLAIEAKLKEKNQGVDGVNEMEEEDQNDFRRRY